MTTHGMDNGLQCRFQLERPAFSLDVNLALPGQGITAVFGHSGSGKTTLLRCVAGLEQPTRGFARINGHVWQDHNHFLPTHKRGLGYVFQESSLFPHLRVKDNLFYASKRAVASRKIADFDHAVRLLGIETLLNRYPAQLSGGERQRVAIARALLTQPTLLLMDEPLASLDQRRKAEIFPYLETLKRELTLPILYVTHSPDEVARLADTLVVMDRGRIAACGPLGETLSRLDFPLNLGEETGVVLEARVIERDSQWNLMRVAFDGGSLWLRDTGLPMETSVRVRILARDISLALEHHSDTSIINALRVNVMEISDDKHPGLALVRLQAGNTIVLARLTRRSVHHLNLAPEKALWAQIKSVALVQ